MVGFEGRASVVGLGIIATEHFQIYYTKHGARYDARHQPDRRHSEGALPNPKSGTVSPDPTKVVSDIKQASRVEFRVDKAGIVHMPIGRASFSKEQLLENFAVALNALLRAKPATSRGRYLRAITLSTTMSPGIKIDPNLAQKLAEQVKA